MISWEKPSIWYYLFCEHQVPSMPDRCYFINILKKGNNCIGEGIWNLKRRRYCKKTHVFSKLRIIFLLLIFNQKCNMIVPCNIAASTSAHPALSVSFLPNMDQNCTIILLETQLETQVNFLVFDRELLAAYLESFFKWRSPRDIADCY